VSRTLRIEVTLDDDGRVEATLEEHGVKHTGASDSTGTLSAYDLVMPLAQKACDDIETERVDREVARRESR
jgi:hypothetical protein